MFIFVGLALVFAAIAGGFLMGGGRFEILGHAAPHEMVTIIGAGIGAVVIGNSGAVLKRIVQSFGRVVRGERWDKQDYNDLLCLMYMLVKTIRAKGVVAIESHIEHPEDSRLFNNYPRIAEDHHIIEFICDYLRMMTMNFEDAYQMADAMENDLDKIHAEDHAAHHALQSLSEGLPAIGIVAAVLGIITTMGSIDQPVAILGGLIGSALVGTFLGVLLAYCIIAPIASRLNQIIEGEGRFISLVRTVLVSHLQGQAPQVAIEIGRRAAPTLYAPSFNELEDAVNALPADLMA